MTAAADRTIRLISTLACVLLLSPFCGAQPLQNRLDGLFSDAGIGSTKMSVIVVDADSTRVLAERNADDQVIPASNMKVITSGSALRVLGPDFVFTTSLSYDQANNRAIVTGSGDPAFGDPELLEKMGLSAEDLLSVWSQALASAGFRKGGELVIDDRIFDREYVHPTWPKAQLNRWYCAEVGGLNFHTNILTIYASPTEEGRPPILRTEPETPWLEIRNRARSISKGQQTAWAARALESNDITFNGDTRSSVTGVDLALHDNPSIFGRMLSTNMAKFNIEPGTVRVADGSEDFSRAQVIHTVRTGMETVLKRCNTDSYNLYAECLLKRMGNEITGTPGSFRTGAAVVRTELQKVLGPTGGRTIIVADGSGMSRENRVTVRAMSEWLAALRSDAAVSRPFIESLADAGLEGTLRKRFRRRAPMNDLHAKTGYLTGVSALSGYLTDPDTGRTLIISIISNDKPSSVALQKVRDLEEAIVMMADDYLERTSPEPAVGG